jgi:hypothetical protein
MTNKEIKAEMYNRTFPFDPIHNYCENIRNRIWNDTGQQTRNRNHNKNIIYWETNNYISITPPEEIPNIDTFEVYFVDKNDTIVYNFSHVDNLKHMYVPPGTTINDIKSVKLYYTSQNGIVVVKCYDIEMCDLTMSSSRITARGG